LGAIQDIPDNDSVGSGIATFQFLHAAAGKTELFRGDGKQPDTVRGYLGGSGFVGQGDLIHAVFAMHDITVLAAQAVQHTGQLLNQILAVDPHHLTVSTGRVGQWPQGC